jgi:hypothetical protein
MKAAESGSIGIAGTIGFVTGCPDLALAGTEIIAAAARGCSAGADNLSATDKTMIVKAAVSARMTARQPS